MRIGQYIAEPSTGNGEIDGDRIQGVAGHLVRNGIRRVLHERHATTALDGFKARSTIAQKAAQDDTDHAGTVGDRRRPEQGIDGRPRQVFAWTTAKPDSSLGQDEVMVGDGKIDVAGFDCHPVDGLMDRQMACRGCDRRENADTAGWNVQDNENSAGRSWGRAPRIVLSGAVAPEDPR